MQQFSEFFAQRLFVAEHVSGVVPPIIRSVQLHPQSLVLHKLQVDGCSVVGRGLPGHDQQRYIHQPATYVKPETAGAVVRS